MKRILILALALTWLLPSVALAKGRDGIRYFWDCPIYTPDYMKDRPQCRQVYYTPGKFSSYPYKNKDSKQHHKKSKQNYRNRKRR